METPRDYQQPPQPWCHSRQPRGSAEWLLLCDPSRPGSSRLESSSPPWHPRRQERHSIVPAPECSWGCGGGAARRPPGQFGSQPEHHFVSRALSAELRAESLCWAPAILSGFAACISLPPPDLSNKVISLSLLPAHMNHCDSIWKTAKLTSFIGEEPPLTSGAGLDIVGISEPWQKLDKLLGGDAGSCAVREERERAKASVTKESRAAPHRSKLQVTTQLQLDQRPP